jgi:hypothetical protein
MTEKKPTDRPIDRIRNSGGSFTVGEPGEINQAMIATKDRLFSVTKGAIYAVQLADQIDPERTNIALPRTVQQKVLGYGADSDFVAATFMTGAELFNTTYLGQAFPADRAKLLSLELATRLAVLQDTLNALIENERRVVASLDKPPGGSSYRVPETTDLRTKVETFASAADRIQETLFALAHLFYPKPKGQLDTRAHLLAAVEKATPGRAEFHSAIKSIIALLHEVREHRNASVHQDGPKALLLKDFHLMPSGQLSAPLMEIRHPQFALAETPITQYMADRIRHLTEASEALIAWLCAENITLQMGPIFEHQIAQLPDGERRFGSRFYYHTVQIGPLPTAAPEGPTEGPAEG